MKNNIALIALMAFGATMAAGVEEPYHLVTQIQVGGDGGWDYASIDSAARRLYVTHGTKIVVIDLSTDKVVGEVDDTPGVHGFAIAPDLGLGFSSNGREAKAGIVELKTLKTLSKVATGENPDAILYESSQQEVYTFNGRGHSATVFQPKTGNVVATIPLPGKPEFAVEDVAAGRIYDNIEDKDEVVVLDAKTHKVVNEWPIAPGESASGMAIDEVHHRLFLGCANKLMVMMDSSTGNVLDKVEIGKGVDANSFDPKTQYAFASCGDGTVTIARIEGDKLHVVQTLKTEQGARTMTLDPQTHNIYLASARFEPQAENKGSSPRQRPKQIANSFKVLVYGLAKN